MFLKNPMFNIIFFETLGTLILAFGISVTEYVHPISRHIINPFWTFLISCFNFLAISVSGPFSGGHVNSSVTVGLYAGKIVQGRRVLPYVLSQIGGAILGTLLCKKLRYFQIMHFLETRHKFIEKLQNSLRFYMTELVKQLGQ